MTTLPPALARLKSGGFAPNSAEILSQFDEPPAGCEVDLKTLTPFLRALLEIDGTVTRFLEAYALEPIEILKLGQGEIRFTGPVELLEADAASRVTTRQVLLCGRDSRRIYAYGSSLILPDRLPAASREALNNSEIGLGQIMSETRMETYREIVWRYREHSRVLPRVIQPLADRGLVCRTYRVFHRGLPIMMINEKFPSDAEPDAPGN